MNRRAKSFFVLNMALYLLAFLSIPFIVEWFAVNYAAITVWSMDGGIVARFIGTRVASVAATVTFGLGIAVGTMSSVLILMSKEEAQ